MELICAGRSGKHGERCAAAPVFVDRTGATWCGTHADRSRCQQPSREALPGLVALRRSQQPAGGTASRADLESIPWAHPDHDDDRRAWAERTRALLAESPLRSLASAGLQARDELREARSRTRIASDGREARP